MIVVLTVLIRLDCGFKRRGYEEVPQDSTINVDDNEGELVGLPHVQKPLESLMRIVLTV